MVRQAMSDERARAEARKSGDWSYCPACGGGIDTGYECGKCGRDWLEYHQTKTVALHAARAEALDEAAKVVEDYMEACGNIAQAIRQLKEAP